MFLAKRLILKTALSGVAVLAGLAMAGTAAAQAVVVRSTGPSAGQYPQGKKIPANTTVTLRAGDRVTVVDKAGSRVLSGPGAFAINGQVNRDGGANPLSGLLRGGNARSRTGAVRGAPGEAPAAQSVKAPAPDSLWYIDVSKGGTYCVSDPASLVLWRPNNVDAGMGRLFVEGGASADIAWRRGNSLKLWPVSLPVVDGKTYSFTHPVGPVVQITTRLIGAVPAEDVDLVALLAEKGCQAQLDLLASAASAVAVAEPVAEQAAE